MLPEDAAVILPDAVPASLEGHESRVEGVALGPADDLPGASAVERPQQVDRVSDLKGFQVGLHRWPAQFGEAGETGVVDLAATPPQQQPKQRQEPLAVTDGEQLEDVTRVEAVDPFGEEAFGLFLVQQCIRQASVEKSAVQTGHAEWLRALLPQDGIEMDRRLTAGQRVAELPGGGEGRGSGGQDLQMRVLVRCDLQQTARIPQLVHLVEDDNGSGPLASEEQLGVFESPRDGRQVTVHVDGARQHSGEGRLPHPAHTGQPNDGTTRPCVFHQAQPKRTLYHRCILHIDRLYDK